MPVRRWLRSFLPPLAGSVRPQRICASRRRIAVRLDAHCASRRAVIAPDLTKCALPVTHRFESFRSCLESEGVSQWLRQNDPAGVIDGGLHWWDGTAALPFLPELTALVAVCDA
jgi:hypothetical protein